MPKAKDKENIRKKQRSSNGTNDRTIKKKLVRSSNITDEIELSKTLAAKMTKTKVRTTRVTNTSIQNSAPKICGNGKPMPSLAELEKMFEDSDNDIDDTPCNALRCKTPEQTSSLEKVPVSPTTLKNITHKVMDYISNLTGKNDLSVEEPSPPIVPQKRPKKSDVPYIVGCVNRQQVPWNPKKKNFGTGEDEYGVKPSSGFSSEEENKQFPAKRRRRSKKVNLSKSIFNANTEEIVRKLSENDSTNISESSTDSNQTITYDINNSSCSSENNTKPRRFSPLPSTSNDHEIFLKNHEIFKETLKCNSILLNNTTLLDDNSSVFDSKALLNDTDVEVIEVPCETITLDDEKNNESSSVQVIEDTIHSNTERKKMIANDSPILIDDYYSSIDLNCTYDTDVCEVTDVDDVLAENNAIINKYRKNSDLHSVTCVQPYILQEQNSTEIAVNKIDLSEVVNDNFHTEPTVINSNGIEQVVKNFFKGFTQPHIIDTIDLTKTVQDPRMCNKITSWVKVIDKQFKNKNNESTHNIHDSYQNLMKPNTQIVNTNVPITCTVTSVSNINPITSYLMDLTDNVTSTTTSVTRPSRRTKKNESNSVDKNKLITPVKVTAGHYTSTPKPPQTPVQSSRSIGDCPICMENLSTKQVASTICGHIFCMDCIKSAISKRCPICRKALKGVGYHPLFL